MPQLKRSQLKRSESFFIMPAGEKRSLFVVDTVADMKEIRSSPPPQVILTHGNTKRAYGRERLMGFDYKDVVALFTRDFRLPKSQAFETSLQVTFYRTHGGGIDNSLVSIDQESWAELMKNVTRIDLTSPPPDRRVQQTIVR
ncbi:hypothetical protein H0H81_001219 [Sphagnurus paluster]|uniref:Uncharacterized protein n=1 Tax=Sphagnurus paluster TaxID=117069 RepID=A0A9P7K5X5_9AGAR|nr:hypothetical protein H0H81_001219 [Sphagnurus paluster]